MTRVTLLLCGCLLAMPMLWAQPSRISAPIDKARTVRLRAHVPAKARPQADRGAMDPGFRVDGIALHFKPSPTQQSALEQLLQDQQNPASPNYHRWLTPEEFGDRFGASRADLTKVTAWLESEGFAIGHTSRGRSWMVFGGTARQVQSAFQTSIHRYDSNGRMHFANSTDPAIPAALQDLVSSINGLDDFVPEPDSVAVEATSAGGTHTLAPDDIAAIYNIKKLHQAGIDGTGQKLVIVGQSEIDLDDLHMFRTRYNLAANDPDIVLVPNTTSPGTTSALGEANLDLQWSAAVARNAKIIYVYSRSAFAALTYAVDQNLAPVISASFSMGCEQQNVGGFQTWRSVAQRANAQGITWVNSSGDAGGAACDSNSALIGQNGLSIRFPQSIPEVTSVGGTQFNEGTGTYWTATNDVNGASAMSYIPEAVWNESIIGTRILAGGGGASIFFPKPVWQTGPGVPADGARDTPDVSFTSAIHDGYNVVSGGRFGIFAGTSAAAPVFAGMLTLLNHYLATKDPQSQPGLGNINPALYKLAQTNPPAFHDVITGHNAVPCLAGTPDCGGGTLGHRSDAGYDLATGLGSVDFDAFVKAWNTTAPTESIIGLGVSANPVYQLAQPTAGGSNWTVTLSVAEQAGVSTRLTDFLVDGVSSGVTNFFSSTTIPARGSLSSGIGFRTLTVPVTRTFELRGVDPSGRSWSQTISARFLGPAPTAAVAGAGNGASFQGVYAPGMIMSVFGTNLTTANPQAAGVVPLSTALGGFQASVGGILTPLYYVSPQQINLQIPYETPVGNATLTVFNGVRNSTFQFRVAEAAPGIFVGGDGSTVPFASGSRGQTYILFITGEGQVTPALTTGSAPAPGTTLANLPRPRLPVTMTIGGVPAPIAFAGIPFGLVGVTQINFTVPTAAPLGKQPVVVTVGTTPSSPANFTVNQ